MFRVILVRIFRHTYCIRRDTNYLFVFSPSAGNMDQNNSDPDTFYTVVSAKILKCVIQMLMSVYKYYIHDKISIKFSLLQILVSYRISWRRTAHNVCNSKKDIENKRLANGEGHLRIRSSTGSYHNVIPAKYVCTDFSIAEDWATGELSEFKMNYTDFVSSPSFYLG